MGTVRSWEMFGGHTRPAWSGEIIISDNDPNTLNTIKAQNARRVMGIVVPVTTKGRPGAPIPLSGFGTGKAYGTDKGHLMALDLGGPDISENIVPQSNLWQQSGGWRAVETNVQILAMQWMGIDAVYSPGSVIPPPAIAAFFSVAPDPETEPLTGQPKAYIGTVTKVNIFPGTSGIWNKHRDEETHIFRIEPNRIWWNRQEKTW